MVMKMLSANLDEKRVLAEDIDDRELNFSCPFCNESMILVKGKIKIDHFRHYSRKDCEPEPETEEHLSGKLFLYKFFKKQFHCELEPKLDGFRPDVFVIALGRKIAVEYQCSPLSMEEFIFRTERYRENGIYVLWIFGNNNFCKDASDEAEAGVFRLRNVEKKAHELYFGRVYYLGKRKIIEQIKFKAYTSVKSSNWNGYHEWIKYYKKLREIDIINYVCSPNVEFKHNTWRGNNFYICLFRDFIPPELLRLKQ